MIKKRWFFLLGASFLAGMLWYAMYSEYIIIRLNRTIIQDSLVQSHKKSTLVFFVNHAYKKEQVEITCKEFDPLDLYLCVVHAWAEVLTAEKYLLRPCIIDAATLDATTKTAYISFELAPITASASIYQKLSEVEAFLQTIRINCPFVQQVCFLQNGLPLKDDHLDFSDFWPVTGFILNK